MLRGMCMLRGSSELRGMCVLHVKSFVLGAARRLACANLAAKNGLRALFIGKRFCFCAYSVSCARGLTAIDSQEDPTLAVVLVCIVSSLYNI